MIASVVMLMALAGGADTVKHVPAKDIEVQLKTPPARLAQGDNYSVMTMRRTGPGQVEIHEKDTDVLYVIEGSATMVTGGAAVDPKTTEPGEIRAAKSTGGEARRLAKGDVMTIAKGTPHWISAVDGSITYFVVKVR
jgi:quercetin dioxygenase-like cupin family protein